MCVSATSTMKKVLIFVTTKGDGSIRSGEPYLARFPDQFGNVYTREVARPVQLISNT